MNEVAGRAVTASAPGKIIVIGEHFVVHGSYAVAAAINKRAKVSISEESGNDSLIISGGQKSRLSDKNQKFAAVRAVVRKLFEERGEPRKKVRIKIESEIPPGSGLGSSAAISVATAGALSRFLGHELSEEDIAKVATIGEKSVHRNPSGIDTAASLHGGMILFSKKAGPKPVPLNRAIQVLVIYSGSPRSTSQLISKVSQKKTKFPAMFDHLVDSCSFASLQLVDALSNGDLPYLGALMNLSQATLSWIGVSTRQLDALIESALHGDSCYGAKLTGAGGGGSIIALPKPDMAEHLLERFTQKYNFSFIASIPQPGLRWEQVA